MPFAEDMTVKDIREHLDAGNAFGLPGGKYKARGITDEPGVYILVGRDGPRTSVDAAGSPEELLRFMSQFSPLSAWETLTSPE